MFQRRIVTAISFPVFVLAGIFMVLFSGFTDGITSVLVLLIGILFVFIAVMCFWTWFVSTLEYAGRVQQQQIPEP